MKIITGQWKKRLLNTIEDNIENVRAKIRHEEAYFGL